MKVLNRIILTIILLNIPYLAHTEETSQVFGEWKANASVLNKSPIAYANTTNDSGSTLGVICIKDATSCSPYLVNNLSCEEKAKYPALVYIDEGLLSVELECIHIGKRYLYLLPTNHLEAIITDNKYAVAYGIKGGKFKAAYFNLNGSAKALLAAKKLLSSMTKPNDESGNKKSKYKDIDL